MAPRGVGGCAKPWKRARVEVRNFGVWPLGPQPAERGAFWASQGGCMRHKGNATSPAQPMAPASSQGGLPAEVSASMPLRNSTAMRPVVLHIVAECIYRACKSKPETRFEMHFKQGHKQAAQLGRFNPLQLFNPSHPAQSQGSRFRHIAPDGIRQEK